MTPRHKTLTKKQVTTLQMIASRKNGYTSPYKTKIKRTLDSLKKAGLITLSWKPPEPGNDYGGMDIYSITDMGKAALEGVNPDQPLSKTDLIQAAEDVRRARGIVEDYGTMMQHALEECNQEKYSTYKELLEKWKWEMLACERELVDLVLEKVNLTPTISF